MAENTHDPQLGKFVLLFQGLENSLVGITSAIADKDYAVAILPAETQYRRLVASTDAMFSRFVDLLRQPDLAAKTRFHKLMKKCLDIGVLRDRLFHSKYALLTSAGKLVSPVQENAELKCTGGTRGKVIGEDLSVESFESCFQKIAEVLAVLESFRLQIIGWKHPGGGSINLARKPRLSATSEPWR